MDFRIEQDNNFKINQDDQNLDHQDLNDIYLKLPQEETYQCS